MESLENRIKYIDVEGPLLIFGGPYSNIHALRSMRAIADAKSYLPSQVICTGDIVAYCAYPQECLSYMAEWGIHCIAGNVELNIKADIDDCGCNFEDGTRCDLFSKEWFPYAKSKINSEGLEYINKLPEFLKFEFAGRKVGVLHGSTENTSEFIFKSTDAGRKLVAFKAMDADVIIGGHCGIPFVDHIEDKLWLNAGVIGMPANDGDVRTWYAELLEKDGDIHFAFGRLRYDYEAAVNEMGVKGLVPSYAKTLETGIWDNCDVLPKTETYLQGKEIEI